MRLQEEDQQRANFERYSAQHQQYNQQQRGYDYLKQHQDFLKDGHRRQPNERDLVGQVQDKLGALTGHGQSLFRLNKDRNSNKGVNNNKNEVNHRVRPTSPRTSCKVEESRRDQEQQKQNFPQPPPNSIPSATRVYCTPFLASSPPSHLETTRGRATSSTWRRPWTSKLGTEPLRSRWLARTRIRTTLNQAGSHPVFLTPSWKQPSCQCGSLRTRSRTSRSPVLQSRLLLFLLDRRQ